MSLLTTGTTPKYFDLLDAIGQAAIATNADGTITHWNRSAEDLYGWRREEVLGRDILDVTPSEMSREQAAEIMKSLTAGDVWSDKFRVRGREGESFLVDVTDIPVIGNADRVIGVAGVSARPTNETMLRPVFDRFTASAAGAWPGQVLSHSAIPEEVIVNASEPHLAQLLALLLLRHEEWMRDGGATEIEAELAPRSIFDAFGLPVRPAAHIRLARRTGGEKLQEVLRAAIPTRFAATLVRAIGGVLLAAIARNEAPALHLLLPIRPTSARA